MSTLRERKSSRDFDVVIWGATGFTGQLVAEYFAKHVKLNGKVKWAIAGRDENKLRKVRDQISRIEPSCKDVAILIADSSDQQSIDKVVEKTRVILTTVGPYAKYGTPLVDACVRIGTDYCDLTGESHWIRTLIDKYHKQASQNGVLIVNCCGFDSIPSDIGALMMANHINKRYQRQCSEVRNYVHSLRGGISGGTIASVFSLFDEPLKTMKEMSDPYYLSPPEAKRVEGQEDQNFVHYDKEAKKWTAPFVMASVNARVVRRSAAFLTGKGYSDNFRYREVMSFNSFFPAFVLSVGLMLFGLFMILPPTRWLTKKLLPKSGEGPTKKQREEGGWKYDLIGYTVPQGGEEPKKVKGRIQGFNDPGYGDTCKMISESALCLATQRDQLPYGGQGGVVTPATAFGPLIIDRLNQAGIKFSVEDS